ncbi:MAG: hypothetical protein QXS85_01215 [Acidilobaceae archaeon]
MDRGVSRGFLATLQVYGDVAGSAESSSCASALKRVLKMRALGALSSLHAITQMIVAADLCSRGFRVEPEVALNGGFVDIYATLGDTRVVVEIESGYVPSRWISRLEEYLESRVVWKAFKLSSLDALVVLATPSHVRIPVPSSLLKQPQERSEQELRELQEKIRLYHSLRDKTTPAPLEEAARLARLDGVAVVNIAERRVYYELSKPSSREAQALLR